MEVAGINKSATEQPGNSFRYAYQNLTEKRFQQLCNALLVHHFNDVQVYPVGMADEGIDSISAGAVIYQVKWSSKTERNPHVWLKQTIEDEKPKILRLIEQGRISRYILMTSVAGTTTAQGTGSIQKLDKSLDVLSNELGIPVECWWQPKIDALMDSAPLPIKLSYPEGLIGSDAMLHLIHGSQEGSEAEKMRDTLMQVLAIQFEEDSRIKFSQVEMDHINVADLFVDVQASLLAPPRKATEEFARQRLTRPQYKGGALEHLLKAIVPLTFLLGVPGQGKSTLSQYLCQMHRAAILPKEQQEQQEQQESLSEVSQDPKLPLRIDLKDYAAWLSGRDPYGDTTPPKKLKPRSKAKRSLEQFLAKFCSVHSGGRDVTVEQIQSILKRYPTLLVLDGLDEIADPNLRATAVDEINAIATRLSNTTKWRKFQILVTARPNASGLREPNPEIFETLQLDSLNEALRNEFFIRWCRVHNVPSKDIRKLRKIFDDRTALDHVAKLADNPMQLTILLYLIRRKGDSVPTSRTPLYRSYMETLMEREVNRQQIDRHQVRRVEEVTSFLGWHLHSAVETDSSAGRMSRGDIERTLLVYFHTVKSGFDDVQALFEAASDRFWALTSKVEGTFEFPVQPVREFFAARFLAEWAGQDQERPPAKQDILVELVKRPFWLNTLQFYAGFASPNELAGLRYGIKAAIESARHPLQERVATWALLSDGIFVNADYVQQDIVRELIDDLSVVLAARHNNAETYFPRLAAASGGDQLGAELLRALEQEPADPLTVARVELLRDRTPLSSREFREWWRPKLKAHLGKPDQNAWIKIGATYPVPALDPEDAEKLTLDNTSDKQAALAIGASPQARSATDQLLLQSVLDGECSDVRTSGNSEAGALLRAIRPQWYHQLSEQTYDGPVMQNGHLWLDQKMRDKRSSAFRRLVEVDSRYEQLKKAANARAKGKKGTTEPWQESARVLSKLHGPSLLAAEIAVAGAASHGTIFEGSRDSGGQPFGEYVDYGTLVMEVHRRPNSQWWSHTYAQYTDSLSRSTWVLALLAAADTEIVAEHLANVDQHLRVLGNEEFTAVAAASSRLGICNQLRRLDTKLFDQASGSSSRTKLLLTHFVATAGQQIDKLDGLTDADLKEMSTPEPHGWPVTRTLSWRLTGNPNDLVLAGLERAGPNAPIQLDLDHSRRNLQLKYLKNILNHPEKYPSVWVVIAEQLRSEINEEPVLEEIAIGERWIPKVPRL